LEERLRQSHAALEEAVKQRTAELTAANEQLQLSQAYLKKFAGMLLSVREEERKNISTALHDELGSMALAVGSHITLAREECIENNPDAAHAELNKAEAALRRAVEDLRRLAVSLRPPNLEIMGLTAAVTELVDTTREQTGLKIIFRNELGEKNIDEQRAIVVYRVLQEALTNIAKHARAQQVRIRLYSDVGGIHLQVADDGRGCDAANLWRRKGKPKIGIEGMRERVESLGGAFAFTSSPGKGARITVVLPENNS
jgi:signal transduction histidine kinase